MLSPEDGRPVRSHMILPLDIALIRWSVVSASWGGLSAGHAPLLGPFLAGWYCRCIGASRPEDEGAFRDSFRVGWREADDQITIAARRVESNSADGEGIAARPGI